jgi:heat shock protein HslJ
VRDVATGETVTIVPEAYLPRTQAYQNYSFDLGGGSVSGGYSTVPATASTYEPVPVTPPSTYTPEPAATPSTFLDGTKWRLATLDDVPVTAPGTLNFEAGGRYGGRAACNTYGGEFTAFSNFKINIRSPFSTRRACPQLSEEQAYFGILAAATDFRPGREGDTLALLDAGGTVRATFLRAGDVPGQTGASIAGVWTEAGVLIDGRLETDSGFGAVGIEFFDNGRFAASLGCNTAQGDYSQSGDTLTFGTVAVTARQCFAPAPFEGPILGHLPNIRMVQAIGGGVSLRDASGIELIRLTR